MQSVRKPRPRPRRAENASSAELAVRLGVAIDATRGARWTSAVDDRRWLVSNKLPGAPLAHPNSEVAIVDVRDRARDRDLGRHPSGHQRGAIDNQNAVRRMRDFKVGKVTRPDLVQIAPLVVVIGF